MTSSVLTTGNANMLNLITELYKNPLKTDLNNPLFSKDALTKIKAQAVVNNSLLKVFGEVQSVMPVVSENSNQDKYIIKYKVGSRVATVINNSLGQIINIVSEPE